MSKLARQYLRAVKVWGVGPEVSETRQQATRREIFYSQVRRRRKNLIRNPSYESVNYQALKERISKAI